VRSGTWQPVELSKPLKIALLATVPDTAIPFIVPLTDMEVQLLLIIIADPLLLLL
jgi:hypothetical protein